MNFFDVQFQQQGFLERSPFSNINRKRLPSLYSRIIRQLRRKPTFHGHTTSKDFDLPVKRSVSEHPELQSQLPVVGSPHSKRIKASRVTPAGVQPVSSVKFSSHKKEKLERPPTDIPPSRFFGVQEAPVNHDGVQLVFPDTSLQSIFFAVLSSLYTKFVYLHDNLKVACVRELKQVMSLDLDEKNLYDTMGYRNLRIGKAAVQNSLMYNTQISNVPFMKRYLADYWGINILMVNGLRVHCFNTFDDKRYSLILTVTDTHEIVIPFSLSGWKLESPTTILAQFEGQLKLLTLELGKMKRAKLQELALSYNIPIKKKGKRGLVSKTKSELIQDIQNKFDGEH